MGYLPILSFLRNDIRSNSYNNDSVNFVNDARKVQCIDNHNNQALMDFQIYLATLLSSEDAFVDAESFLVNKHQMNRGILFNDGQDDVRIKYNGNYFVFEGGKYYLMDKQEVSFFISKAIENDYSLMTASFEDWKNNNGDKEYYYW
jgi:hypothetical protein